MKKDPSPVVLEGDEATPGTLNLLDAQVQAFGRAVGGVGTVMVQISVRQRSRISPSDRISSTSSLWHPTMALFYLQR